MRVTNSGASRAIGVQLFAEEVSRKNAAGDFVISPKFLAMPLAWVIEGASKAEGISPESLQLCNLGLIHKAGGPVELTMLVAVQSNNGSFVLPAGHYRVKVRAVAENASSVNEVLEFCLTGTWFSDEASMFKDGLNGAKVLSKKELTSN